MCLRTEQHWLPTQVQYPESRHVPLEVLVYIIWPTGAHVRRILPQRVPA